MFLVDNNEICWHSESSDETLEEHAEQATRNSASAQDWKKFILIYENLEQVRRMLFAKWSSLRWKEYNVKLAAPTGFLASTYHGKFTEDNFSADTVHALFEYPVDPVETPHINWQLVNADLLVIDEISMVPLKIFQHIMNTIQQLYIRPVVLLCSDSQQRQPIETVDGKVQAASSILYHKDFYTVCNRVNFVTQHRCQDPDYAAILDTLRYYKPNQHLLHRLEAGRIMFEKTDISDKDIRKVLLDEPEAKVLTVSSKSTNRVNKMALTLFDTEAYFGEVTYDSDLLKAPLYRD